MTVPTSVPPSTILISSVVSHTRPLNRSTNCEMCKVIPSFSLLILPPFSSLQFSVLVLLLHHCQIHINLSVTLMLSRISSHSLNPHQLPVSLPPFSYLYYFLLKCIGSGRTMESKVWSERKMIRSRPQRKEKITPPWKTSRHGNTVATRDRLAC